MIRYLFKVSEKFLYSKKKNQKNKEILAVYIKYMQTFHNNLQERFLWLLRTYLDQNGTMRWGCIREQCRWAPYSNDDYCWTQIREVIDSGNMLYDGLYTADFCKCMR